MKNKYLLNFKKLSFLLLGLTLSISCSDNEEYGLDSEKVIPTIYEFQGPETGFVEETVSYSVLNRSGSEFIWTVNGAEMQAIPGRTDKINVYFNQFEELVTVSVYEKAANGKTSEVSSMEDIKVFGTPCQWRIEMQDSYGDGWNGASLSISYDGFPVGEYTIDNAFSATELLAVPNGSEIEVTFASGDWDSEITYQIYDASGNLVFSDGTSPAVGTVFTQLNTCP